MPSSELASLANALTRDEGAIASDYLIREVALPVGVTVLVGINKGDTFFVNVYAQTDVIPAQEFAEATRAIHGRFEVFQPVGVRWWIPGQVPEEIPDRCVLAELRLLAAHIPSLALRGDSPRGVLCNRSTLTDELYQTYSGIYERFFSENLRFRSFLRVESFETLSSCAERGGLFTYELDGQLAGFFAADVRSLPPVTGWCIVDEVLDGAFRGRGLAVEGQRELLRRLDQEQSHLVYGTINRANVPSIRTALRVGRLDWGGWVTVSGDHEMWRGA